jgi:hypothetical protein
MTPEEQAQKILKRLTMENGEETFVTPGHSYYEEAIVAIAVQIREAVEEAYEKAANIVETSMEDEHAVYSPVLCYPCDCHDKIPQKYFANAIRAMKSKGKK